MPKKKPKPPKRASKFHSVAYTLKVCEGMGWLAGKTEYRNSYGVGGFGLTKDLYGFIDVLAVAPGTLGVIGLQVTSEACIMRRVHKIMEECREAAMKFLTAQNFIEVWGYKRVYQGKQVRWDARRKNIILTGDGLGLEVYESVPLSVLRGVNAGRQEKKAL